MSLVRKLLFALQTDWYPVESMPWLVEALRVIAEANFSADEVVKPIVAFLAANLHEGTTHRSYIFVFLQPLTRLLLL